MDPVPYNQCFDVRFENGHVAKAVRVRADADASVALRLLGFDHAFPVIFISGGASNMSEDDKRLTRTIIEAVVTFAEDHHCVIIDGGTEAGIMQMLGDVRKQRGHRFRLLGVTPFGKIEWPGHENAEAEAELEDSHSHFILVEGSEWGAESHMIVRLTRAIAGKNDQPAVGILINGGKIALQEIYLASTGEHRLSVIVLEGSGRAADEISTAFKLGRSNQRILQAIVAGGDIEIVATADGPQAMRKMLETKFTEKPS
jgi:hypothetical protein